MPPRIIVPAVAFMLVGLGTAESAPRHKNAQGSWNNAPVRLQGLQQPGFPTRPSWAGPNTCFTDEGYGRFSPCGSGGRS
jgi:hypothetical protein